jgi:hypothetical protein
LARPEGRVEAPGEKRPDGAPYAAKELLDEATRRTQQHLDRIRRRGKHEG